MLSAAAVAVMAVMAVGGCSTSSGPQAVPSIGPSSPSTPQVPQTVCKMKDKRLSEISGIASSIHHPGVVWVNNDSGDEARVFAIDTTTCGVRAVVNLQDVTSRDAEALAIGRDSGGAPTLFLGDIGDNLGDRPSVTVYRFPEPKILEDATVPAAAVTLRYPDGPHDAESLLVDPIRGGQMWIISKEQSDESAFYAAPLGGSGELKRIGSAPRLATDAAYAPDRSSYVVRSYLSAEQFQAPPIGGSIAPVPLPLQQQGEAITYAADSKSLYIASEGDPDLIRVPLPN